MPDHQSNHTFHANDKSSDLFTTLSGHVMVSGNDGGVVSIQNCRGGKYIAHQLIVSNDSISVVIILTPSQGSNNTRGEEWINEGGVIEPVIILVKSPERVYVLARFDETVTGCIVVVVR